MPENEVPQTSEEQRPEPEEETSPPKEQAQSPAEEAASAAEASPPAPEAPARRTYGPKEKTLIVVLLVAIAAGVYITTRNLYRQYTEAKAQTEAANSVDLPLACGTPPAPEPVGSPDAKVKIVASMGHCIAPAMEAIAKMVSAWPDKVRAEFYALESPDGQQIVQAHNISRACVMINDKIEFTLTKDGKERKVRLEGPPGVDYQLDDIVEALRATLLEVYGKVPEDFDAKAAPLRSLKLKLEPAGQAGCGLSPGCEAPMKEGGGTK